MIPAKSWMDTKWHGPVDLLLIQINFKAKTFEKNSCLFDFIPAGFDWCN
jgi:hypothetical protein